MLFPQEPDAVCRLGDPAKGGNTATPLKDERFKNKQKKIIANSQNLDELISGKG